MVDKYRCYGKDDFGHPYDALSMKDEDGEWVRAEDYVTLEAETSTYVDTLVAERRALEADRDQISLTLDVAKADRDKWFNRARDLEKALHKLDDELTVEEVDPDDCRSRCLKILDEVFHYTNTTSETPAKSANETLSRSALGNLLAAVIKFGPIDADIELAMREARQIMGFPFTSDRAGGK